MFIKAKKQIDQIVREEEMTDGLPESLLVGADNCMKESKKDDLYNVIYTVCEQAVKELDSKKKRVLRQCRKCFKKR